MRSGHSPEHTARAIGSSCRRRARRDLVVRQRSTGVRRGTLGSDASRLGRCVLGKGRGVDEELVVGQSAYRQIGARVSGRIEEGGVERQGPDEASAEGGDPVGRAGPGPSRCRCRRRARSARAWSGRKAPHAGDLRGRRGPRRRAPSPARRLPRGRGGDSPAGAGRPRGASRSKETRGVPAMPVRVRVPPEPALRRSARRLVVPSSSLERERHGALFGVSGQASPPSRTAAADAVHQHRLELPAVGHPLVCAGAPARPPLVRAGRRAPEQGQQHGGSGDVGSHRRRPRRRAACREDAPAPPGRPAIRPRHSMVQEVEDAPGRDVDPVGSHVDLVAQFVHRLLEAEEVEQAVEIRPGSDGRYGLPAATSRYESRNCPEISRCQMVSQSADPAALRPSERGPELEVDPEWQPPVRRSATSGPCRPDRRRPGA